MATTLRSVLDWIQWGRQKLQDDTGVVDAERPKCGDHRVTVQGGSEHLFTRSDFALEIPGGRTLVHVTIHAVSDPSRFAFQEAPVATGQCVTVSDLFAGNLKFVPGGSDGGAWLEVSVFDGVAESQTGRVTMTAADASERRGVHTAPMPKAALELEDVDSLRIEPVESPSEPQAEPVESSAVATAVAPPAARLARPTWSRVRRVHNRRRNQDPARGIRWDRRRQTQCRSAAMRRRKG